MTLSAEEFLRRYVQHILPHGFVRIRQFGFLAHAPRCSSLVLLRELLPKSFGVVADGCPDGRTRQRP